MKFVIAEKSLKRQKKLIKRSSLKCLQNNFTGILSLRRWDNNGEVLQPEAFPCLLFTLFSSFQLVQLVSWSRVEATASLSAVQCLTEWVNECLEATSLNMNYCKVLKQSKWAPRGFSRRHHHHVHLTCVASYKLNMSKTNKSIKFCLIDAKLYFNQAEWCNKYKFCFEKFLDTFAPHRLYIQLKKWFILMVSNIQI